MPFAAASLYIHIPFCHKKCSYCDFFSAADEGEWYSGVLSEIISQITYFLLSSGSPEIETIYIGGGTPSSLPLSMLDLFLTNLKSIVPKVHREFTIEVNPEDVTRELLLVFEKRGVTRLSMGVQSLNDKVLKVLGRNTDSERTLSALRCIEQNWQGQKNFDIITSIPGQHRKEALADIEGVTAFDPDHVSLYTLTFEKGTPLTRRLINGDLKRLPENIEIPLYEASIALLESSGYHRYEVSNYCKEGFESVHNRRYWEMRPYFGAGPAGVSTIPNISGPVRIENPKNIHTFLSGKKNRWGWTYEEIDPSPFFLEHLMMGFRLTRGIDLERIQQIFSVDLLTMFPQTLHMWKPFLRYNGKYVSLTQRGLNLLDSFLSSLVTEFNPSYVTSCIWP